MLINSINSFNNESNTQKCCKPRRRLIQGFSGNDCDDNKDHKVRYKHYEEISDDVLRVRSILKAYDDVEKSGKMKFFKAIPAITTGLIGLSIGLTQPGKLSSKAATGLGFLALFKASDIIFNGVDKAADKIYSKKEDNEHNRAKKSILKTGLSLASVVGLLGAAANIKKLGNVEKLKPLTNFVSKESQTLAKEINSTKMGDFFEKTVEPFTQKHKDLTLTTSILAPIGIMAGSTFAALKTADSLSDDIKEKSNENYAKGKIIQALAREHFDSIDAIEV